MDTICPVSLQACYHAMCVCVCVCLGDDKRRLPPKTVFVQVKRCPACRYPIEKNGGCPHMTCSLCRKEFCWFCRADWMGHNYSYCSHVPEIVSNIRYVFFDFYSPPPSERYQRHSVFGLSVRAWSYTKSLSTWCLANHFWEFRQIYDFGAVGDEGEPIRFRGQKVRVTVTERPPVVVKWAL